MSVKKSYYLVLVLFFYSFIGFGQEEIPEYLPQIAPPSPSAFQFIRYGNIGLNGNSGGFNYSIPIYTIEHNDISIPISADYFSAGVRVDELSGILGTDWNLNTGGVVARVMKGIPDDIAKERWYEWNPELYGNNLNLNKLVSVAKGEGIYDSEPDWFSFNVNGVSGEFYLDENLNPHVNSDEYFKVEFIRYQSSRGYGKRSSFIFTDNRGYKFVFGGEEHENNRDLYLEANRSTRDCFVGPDDKYYSSWYLKEIISPTQNKVTFTYSDNNLKYYTHALYNLDHYPNCQGISTANIIAYDYRYSDCRYSNDIQSKVLSEISFGNKRVEFEYNSNRKDGGGKILEQIKIFKDSSSDPIKVISFSYDEVQNRNTPTDSKLKNTSSLLYRVFLNEISFKDKYQNIGEIFRFDYYNKNQLPRRLSFSKDKYGFNNGSNNLKPFSQKLQVSPIKFIMNQTGSLNQATADLEVNPNKVYYGMLKKITYPTGGYSEISYEANSTLKNKKKLNYNEEYIHIKKDCNESTKTESFCFISNGTPIILDGALVELDEFHNNGTCIVQPDSAHDKYTIKIYKDGVVFFSKTLNYGQSLSPANPFASCITTNNNYFDGPICTEEGSEYKITITTLSKPFNPAEGSIHFRYNSEEISQEMLTHGAGARVSEIKDFDGNSHYNKRSFYYNELEKYPSLESSQSNILKTNYWEELPMSVYCNNLWTNNYDYMGVFSKFSVNSSSVSQLFLTRSSLANYSVITEFLDDKERGSIERKYFEVIDDFSLNILNSPIYNTPISNSQSSFYLNKLKEEIYYNSDNVKIKKRLLKYKILHSGTIPGLVARKNQDILNVMFQNDYEIITHSASNYLNFYGTVKLEKIEQEDYFLAKSVKNMKEYLYGDFPYFQLKEKVINTSFNHNLNILYKYPFDFPSDSKMQTLVAQNRIGSPVEVQQKIDGTLVNTSKIIYGSNAQTSGHLLPVKIQAAKGNNSLEDRVSFDRYDSKGNILQVSKAGSGSTKIAYIWDASGNYPLAKISNKTYTSIGAGLINNIHTASQGSNETALKNALNALRTTYKNDPVLIDTYTYHPLFGMTSATDPSGISTYYEYDGFGRLNTIKDHNQNRLQSYAYNYDANGINNYVLTGIYKNESGNDFQLNTTYVDGLGRPVQEIAHGQSGLGNDLVTPIAYDGFGRAFREYLPYDRGSSSQSKDADALSKALTFYNNSYFDNTTNPYTETLYEDSPLIRVLKEAAPGNDWQMGSGHEIKFDYDTNKNNEVYYFGVNYSGETPSLKLIKPGIKPVPYYAAKELYKTITKDENHQGNTKIGTTEEFKNKLGQVVLKRNWNAGGTNNNTAIALDTYYVYDVYGNLVFVLPPLLAEQIVSANNLVGNHNSLIDKLGYRYRYDHRNRMIHKKLPGRQTEYIAYDPLDRPVAVGPVKSPFLNQDNDGMLHTRYDAFDRVVHSSWAAATNINETFRKNIENSITTKYSETPLSSPQTKNGLLVHYTSTVAPPANRQFLSSNLYDEYPNWVTDFSSVLGQTPYYNQTQKPKGMETAQYVRVLENTSNTAHSRSYSLYDSKQRLIRQHTQNHLGGYTQTDQQYDFIGKVLQTQTKHKRTVQDEELKIEENFAYTPEDRLLSHTHKINSDDPETLSLNEYDPLGQLMTKKVGKTGNYNYLQHINYTYNIRGWLTNINSVGSLAGGLQTPQDLFAFRINYNTLSNAHPDVEPLYNGNISQTFWRTANDNILRSYGYVYDPLNRLLDAFYIIPNSSVVDSYNEHLTYDSNGNILSLKRYGEEESEFLTLMIDDLDYEYDGNQLKNVTDDTAYSEGFHDGNKHQQTNQNDYEYDAYGNMVKDRNKGITEITYNHLNLPKKISFGSLGTIEYIYGADGSKLQKKVTEVSTNKTVDYLGGFQYENGNMEFFPTAEGYVKVTETGSVGKVFSYVYNHTDHLGNIRLRYTRDPEEPGKVRILEENSYYPFGLKHEGYNGNHEIIINPGFPIPYPVKIISITPFDTDPYQYKYQGQERQDELGLNWDSFKWRNYDYAIGRFMSVDPLAEDYAYQSVYQFASNQPIHANEIEGLENRFDLNMRFSTAEKLSDRGHGTVVENYKAVQQAEQQGSELAANGALVIVTAITPIPGDEVVATSLLLKTGGAVLDVASQAASGDAIDVVGPAMNYVPFGPFLKEGVDAVLDIKTDGTISTPWFSTDNQSKPTSEVITDFSAGMISNKLKNKIPKEVKNSAVGNIISEGVIQGAENIGGHLIKSSFEDEKKE